MSEYLTSSDFMIIMIKIIVIFGGVMGALVYLTWIERKVMARVQMRPGPTRVGPFGLLQPIADGLKFLFKEDVVPANANRFLYIAAPVVSLIPALLSFSVIPFGPWLQVTDLSVGLLFIFALSMFIWLPGYVERAGIRYTESFFSALLAAAGKNTKESANAK